MIVFQPSTAFAAVVCYAKYCDEKTGKERGDFIVPIVGVSKRTHLLENQAALTVRLTPNDLKRIEEVAPRGFAAGERYPKGMTPTWKN